MELYYQKLLEAWLKTIWTGVAIVSIAVAYWAEDQTIAWKASLLLAAIVSVVAVPDWPMYKKHSIVFRGVDESDASTKAKVKAN